MIIKNTSLCSPNKQSVKSILIDKKIQDAQESDIIYFTKFFHDKCEEIAIFNNFNKLPQSYYLEKSKIVAIAWHTFSEFMPKFLSIASSKVSNNIIRHNIIKIVYEELGESDITKIHSDTFLKAVKLTALTFNDKFKFLIRKNITKVLSSITLKLISCRNDSKILGILLGMEIPANQIIETLFKSLCHTKAIAYKLNNSEFFVVHKRNEDSHIYQNVSNYIRYCNTEIDKNLFLSGFFTALNFWKNFWDKTSEMIENEFNKNNVTK